jgi:citrate lyase subunit beta/citryl-CoA lyase
MFGYTALYVPVTSQKIIDKGLSTDVDTIIFDLEDSVAAAHKTAARTRLSESLAEIRDPKQCIAVRINAVTTPYWEEDTEAVSDSAARVVILPNATAAAVRTLSEKLDALGSGLKIVPLIETPGAVELAGDIITASSRVVGVQFGAEDYTKAMQVKRTAKGDEFWYARCRIANIGHMYDVEILDTPFSILGDEAALRFDAYTAKRLGFTGKTVIHPDHIQVVREVFMPSKEEIEKALHIVAQADALGDGRENADVFMLDGEMIDVPVVDRARDVLIKAKVEVL